MGTVNGSVVHDSLLEFGRKLKKVEIPELPNLAPEDEVYVRGLSAGDRAVIQELLRDGSFIGENEYCFLGAFRANGERRFTPEQAKELDGRISQRLAGEVLKASGMLKESEDTAAKNSESSPS